MENTNAAIIEELKNSVRRIREELGELENRLSELQPEEAQTQPDALDISLEDNVPAEESAEEVAKEVAEDVAEEVFGETVEETRQADKLFFESVMTDTLPWKIDVPGSAVHNILSAISLNDRVLFIKSLFDDDPVLFQNSITAFNGMSSLAEVEDYIAEHFSKWKMDSDVVYRFMMAVRRKLS